MRSAMELRPGTRLFLQPTAMLNTFCFMPPTSRTLPEIPLRISSQTAGTPTSTVGLNAIRSHSEPRTLAAVSVLIRP